MGRLVPAARLPAGILGMIAALWMLAAAGTATAAPVAEFPERTFHAGKVIQGKVVEHAFPVSNTGDAPLVIEDVSTPCGCTAVVPDDPVIQPGETTHIGVTYDSSVRSGEVERVITVTTNDPETPVTTLHLLVTVDTSMHEAFKSGEALFGEKCGRCHAEPARGLTGEPLYRAVCWYCHGNYREGRSGPALNTYPKSMKRYLKKVISRGRDGTEMPGYAKKHGGPLSRKQVASLVKLLLTPPPEPPPMEEDVPTNDGGLTIPPPPTLNMPDAPSF